MSITTTLLPAQVHAIVAESTQQARTEVFAAINRILDTYDTCEDDEIGECAPEDRWRLYRDLRALAGITE